MKNLEELRNYNNEIGFEEEMYDHFIELVNSGKSVLVTVGREEPYEHHGEYIIFPWYDSNGNHNKYNDKDLENIAEAKIDPNGAGYFEFKNGKDVDDEGHPYFDEPDPKDYDVVLIRYMPT